MPKRTDISSIMIIGAGPIVIGQACEFDYSGAQACRALKQEGYRIILVNSNPATIMTDPELTHATYIEPIQPKILENIIKAEKPDALLPTMGGQTALNAAMTLEQGGVLEKYGVELIGARAESIEKAENRLLFREAMTKIGLESPQSRLVSNISDARKSIKEIGLPIIIRPSFTLGGAGGGIAYNTEDFEQLVLEGIAASPVGEVLVEESVLGWKEYEMEVIRDQSDNCIIICSIENLDPMGIHTGDSITVAPAQTLTDKEYQIMRNASISVLREIGVDTGGSNVQFALNPKNGRLLIIEMNPRVSRSSALASKATGFPIAKVAAKLSVGYTLDELDNDITGVTPASFEPSIDYVVTKVPRFTFEKFPQAKPLLNTSMKSVGEAMAIGKTFLESLQKGLQSIETGLTGLNDVNIPGAPDRDSIIASLSTTLPNRILYVAQAFRLGLSIEEVKNASFFDLWFLEQIKYLVDTETQIKSLGLPSNAANLLKLKKLGFSDARLSELTGIPPKAISDTRVKLSVQPVYKRVDSCAAEFSSKTSYLYSCYLGDSVTLPETEVDPTDREKIIILGGGPNRIGQGIEFDYCCVHATYAMREAGYETIMVNCNPETVSTDFDISDRLYFEPLTDENVLELIKAEKLNGTLKGVVVQFGGQTPLKLSDTLQKAEIPILGTSPDTIDLAEDRERFKNLIKKIGLRQPPNGTATNIDDAKKIANGIGYPVVMRPSYVLGGRAMEIIESPNDLQRYMESTDIISNDSPILIDLYLRGAVEVDIDALCDGSEVYIAGIMEHIEEAGIHSGDSACSLPPHSLEESVIKELKIQTQTLALKLGVIGLVNIQFAVQNNTVFILEVNPRASRTTPFVAKATGLPIAKIAAQLMIGKKLRSFALEENRKIKHVAVKEAVFPFSRFPGVDIILGPEMKSTGEVMGIDKSFSLAFAKSQLGAGVALPENGQVFLSVKDADKEISVALARKLLGLGFSIVATNGTVLYLAENGINVERINKVLEGRPHCVDAIKSGKIQLIINTSEGKQAIADSFSIRESALSCNIPHYTTTAGAFAAISAIEAIKNLTPGAGLEVTPLQSYFSG